MSFSTPLALLLLLALPIVAWFGWPRGRRRGLRAWSSLALRLLILTLLVLALAGVSLVRAGDQLAVVFLLDRSDSVDEAGRAAQDAFVNDALAAMQPDDQAAVVVFGANALVERPMSASAELGAVRSTPLSGGTDLEEAIQLAMALFPEGAARRIVLLSDGVETTGDAATAARRAEAGGIQIDVVPLTRQPGSEVQVTAFDAPDQVLAGQQFDLSVVLESDRDTDVVLSVLSGGEPLFSGPVTLQAGANQIVIPDLTASADAGFTDFQVRIEPADADTYYQNNALAAFTRVTGTPRVMIVRPETEDVSVLVEALASLDYTVVERLPSELPTRAAGLEDYASVLLANVPASALSEARMEALQSWVRDLGGGLIVIGGPNSFGPGGYFQTPLEAALPVESQIRDQQRLPQLTIVYVIDRSGSMAMLGPSGVENIDLAKEAIVRSIDFLQPTDRAGVVSFDTEGYWIADIQPVVNRLSLQTLVAQLRAGGGTDILAGMRLAGEALRSDPSERKHIILLTDGGAPEMGLTALARELNEDAGITISVIAMGAGAADYLANMAEAGGGNYHAVTEVESIPAIFTQETVLATRSYILEGAFTPTLFQRSPILSEFDSVPPLLGYVATTPRETAQVLLRGDAPYFDPILAQWQYGLGRAVAFTSDAGARWAGEWAAWDEFPRFWSQAVQWTIIETTGHTLESFVALRGEQAVLTVDARAADGSFLNGATLQAVVLPPNQTAFTVPVRQTAPGRYEAEFTPGGEGAYLVTLDGVDANDAPIRETLGWVSSYSPEYSLNQRGTAGLPGELAALTGGRDLSGTPADSFARTLQAQTAVNPISFELLLLALLLVPLDVAVRRLLITRSDLSRARAALRRKPQESGAANDQMQTLKEAKARRREVQPESAAPLPAPRPAPTPAAPAQPAPLPTAESGNLAGELLKRRKKDN